MIESKTKTRDLSIDPKKDLYKELSKKVDRYKNLPRIKLNTKDLSHNGSRQASNSIDYGSRGRF